jgi:hypothetical protein
LPLAPSIACVTLITTKRLEFAALALLRPHVRSEVQGISLQKNSRFSGCNQLTECQIRVRQQLRFWLLCHKRPISDICFDLHAETDALSRSGFVSLNAASPMAFRRSVMQLNFNSVSDRRGETSGFHE